MADQTLFNWVKNRRAGVELVGIVAGLNLTAAPRSHL